MQYLLQINCEIPTRTGTEGNLSAESARAHSLHASLYFTAQKELAIISRWKQAHRLPIDHHVGYKGTHPRPPKEFGKEVTSDRPTTSKTMTSAEVQQLRQTKTSTTRLAQCAPSTLPDQVVVKSSMRYSIPLKGTTGRPRNSSCRMPIEINLKRLPATRTTQPSSNPQSDPSAPKATRHKMKVKKVQDTDIELDDSICSNSDL